MAEGPAAHEAGMTQEMTAEPYLSPRTSQGKTFAVRPRKQPLNP